MEKNTHVYEILEFFWQREHQEMSLPCLSLQVGKNYYVLMIIIRQIFSLARDWSKRVTWANIPQLKLGNIQGYSPIFKTDG